jgi:ABC-type transport system involved in cytochrome bd biosynthesis fused ATPase/permease subunit
MLKSWQYTVLNAIGALALLLVLFNAVLFTKNRDLQQQVNARQQYLQQTTALEGLYRDIVKALAELAVSNNDTQLLEMLASQGLNVSVNAPAPTPASPPAAVKR